MIYATKSFMTIVVMYRIIGVNSGQAEDKGCCKKV